MKCLHRAVLLIASLLLTVGCANRARFDPHTRTACFDALWSALDLAYWDAEAMPRLGADGRRRALRKEFANAGTRREYLIQVAGVLAALDDPHAQCDDLRQYWREHTGQDLTACFQWLYRVSGAYWISFSENALALELAAGTPVAARHPYELLAVENVRACVATLALLEAPEGQTVQVLIRDADGCPRQLTVLAPLPPAVQFGFEPSSPRSGSGGASSQPTLARRAPSPIGYARIPGFEKHALLEAFDRDLSPLLSTDSLVLDLRGNSGGKFDVLSATLGRFLTEPRRIADLEVRVPRLLPLGPATWRLPLALLSFPRPPAYRRPVVVMIDGATGSSAEIAALALRDLVGATLVGERTIGAGAGVAMVRLPDGLKIRFGSQLIRGLDGATFQGRGIEPDVAVELDPEELRLHGRRAFDDWRRRVNATALQTARERSTSSIGPVTTIH